MTPISDPSSSQGLVLVSGTFKVSKHQSVTGWRANVTTGSSCHGGVLKISGSQPLIFAKDTSNLLYGVDAGHNKWAVATGGNPANPGLVQPTAVVITAAGPFARPAATLSIVFASKSKGMGRLAWSGSACGFRFSVKRR
jgi:hypothetical protein